MKQNILFAVIASTVFFLSLLLTLSDYGPSWDETLHFSRGQAYLNFFLTGRRDYQNISNSQKSFYHFDYHTGRYWFKENGGHPPLSDILAAVFNYIFFQKLKILSDIFSYHLFNIVASSLLVFVVVFFAISTIGKFASIISFLTLMTYPLFWAESHFNVKDPPEAAFFSATILTFYQSLKGGSAVWLLFSIIFFSFGLGTKFNILFLPFIILPYLGFRYRDKLRNLKGGLSKIPRTYLIVLVLSPIIIFIIFMGSWPYLWDNWPGNLIKVLRFYQHIGTGFRYQPENFFLGGFNAFPTLWILFTTPPIVLALFLVGLVSSIKNWKIFGNVTILWLIWLIVPILRVSIPGTTIYGGVRQILEFLPAFVLIAGLGAWQIVAWSTKFLKNLKLLIQVLLILLFVWPTFILFKMHPNQNVYFNSLIGGLKGAKDKNFPSWGNSYGNAYFQGIKWINENVPYGSKLSLIQGIETNAPKILFRPDINFDNSNWSGIEREGEYLMELVFDDTGRAFYYTWEYVDKFLEPVYQLEVDDVPILKIWKNDLEHTKANYQTSDKLSQIPLKMKTEENRLVIEFEREIILSKVELKFIPKEGCSPIQTTFVDTSLDNQKWLREKDWIPFPQVGDNDNLEGNTIVFHFAVREARFVRFWFDNIASCGLNSAKVRFFHFNP